MGRLSPTQHRRKGSKALLALLVASLVTGSQATLARDLIDKIAAEVNKVPVLHSHIMSKVDEGPLITVHPYPATAKSSKYDQALNDAVNYELVLQTIEEMNIVVSDEDVEQRIKAIMTQNNINQQQLQIFLQQQNKSLDSFREDTRKQMLIARFQGRVIMPKIKITEKSLTAHYLTKHRRQGDSAEIALRQILVRVPRDATEQHIKRKEKLILTAEKQLLSGTPFIEVEKIYSNLDAGRNKEQATTYNLKDLAKPIRDGVALLKQGEFSKPIRTGLGFHLFYVANKNIINKSKFEAMRSKLEHELRMIEMGSQTIEWIKKRRLESKITVFSETT